MESLTFAVDFDGTCVEHEFPKIGKEKPNCLNTLNDLQQAGHKIIIWTCREGKTIDEMLEWFNDRGFVPDAVNENIEDLDFAKHKVVADVYIDDRSFPPFTNWDDVRNTYLDDIGSLFE